MAVDGHPMRVKLEGLEHLGKAPTVVFEAGGGATMDGWGEIPAEIAKRAPVVAYDRAGYGGSEDDGAVPTPRHDVEKLHRLLGELRVKPPYIMVGHSWGGPLIRLFAATYPREIAGLVYVEPTDLRTEEQDTAYLLSTGFTPEAAVKYHEEYWRDWGNYVATLQPRTRAEMDVITEIERSGAPEFQKLPPVRDIPVSVLLGGKILAGTWVNRPCEPDICFSQWLDYRKEWLKPLTAEARPARVIVDPLAGHDMPRDNPAFVTAEIREILSSIPAAAAAIPSAPADPFAPDGSYWSSRELCLMSVVPGAPFSAEVSIVWRPPAGSGRSEMRVTSRYFRDSAGSVRVEQGTIGGQTPRILLALVDGTSQVYNTEPSAQTVYVYPRDMADMMIGAGCHDTFVLPFVNQRGGRASTAFVSFSQFPNHPESLGERMLNGTRVVGMRFMPSSPLQQGTYFDRRAERWVAPDLNLVMSLYAEEPETGSFEYRVTRVSRAEPSAGLFEAPDCYVYQNPELGRPFRCDGDAVGNDGRVGSWMNPQTFLETYR